MVWLLLVGFQVHAVVYRDGCVVFGSTWRVLASFADSGDDGAGRALYLYAEVPALTLVVLGAVGCCIASSYCRYVCGGHAPEVNPTGAASADGCDKLR